MLVDNSAADEPYAADANVDVILRRPNDGYAGGANAGLKWWLAAAECEDETEVVVACHDAQVHPDALTGMLDSLQQLPVYGVIGVGGGGGSAPTAPTGPTFTVTPRPWLSGSLLLLRRSALDRVGLFDQRLESYVEDVDLCFRLWDAGWSVGAVDSMTLRWNGSRSDGARKMMIRNWLLIAYKRRGLVGFLVVLGVELPPVVRSGIAALTPWRTTAARRASRCRFSLLWSGVREGYLGRRVMRQ